MKHMISKNSKSKEIGVMERLTGKVIERTDVGVAEGFRRWIEERGVKEIGGPGN